MPPPKEMRPSRPSMLHVSASQPELASHSSGLFRRRTGRRSQHSLIGQLASLKHWIVESAKRAKSPHPRTPKSSKFQPAKNRSDKTRPGGRSDAQSKQATSPSPNAEAIMMTPTQIKRSSNASSLAPNSASYAHHRNSYGRAPRNTSHRNSLSPAPLTPRGSYRRSSAGLRGRKSTSSSVSSVRTIYHAHSHSKASSISSNSVDTMSTPTASTRISRSPHTSVKLLPATPNATSRFPNNIRLVRNPPHALRDLNEPNSHGIYSVFNEAVAGPLTTAPQSPGFVFARRKRTPFRGPMLHTNTLMFTNGPGTPSLSPPLQREATPGETVKPQTRKSLIIMEEDDDNVEEEIEEVDTFSDSGGAETTFTAVNEDAVDLGPEVNQIICSTMSKDLEEENETSDQAGHEMVNEDSTSAPAHDPAMNDPIPSVKVESKLEPAPDLVSKQTTESPDPASINEPDQRTKPEETDLAATNDNPVLNQ